MLKIKSILFYFMSLSVYLLVSCTGEEGPRVFDCTTLKDCRANQNCQYKSIDAKTGVCSNRIPCKSDNDCSENMVCSEDGRNKFCGTRNVFSIKEQILPDAPKGQEYLFSKFQVENNNFKDFYFEIREDSELPQGLKLTPEGEIKGTPTANAGEYSFVVVAYNGSKDSTHYYNYRKAVKEFKIKITQKCDEGYIGEDCEHCDTGYHRIGENCIIDEVCDANSCTDLHKSVCTVLSGVVQCDCDEGYRGDNCDECDPHFHSVGSDCVADEVCEQNSCTENHKTVCNIVSGVVECSCDEHYTGPNCGNCTNGYHKSAGECVIDEVCEVNSCTETHKSVCNIVGGVVQCFCDDGYEGVNCDICSTGYHLSGQDCVIDEVCEASSCTETFRNVCNIVGGVVECSCNEGYHEKLGFCIPDETCQADSCTEEHKTICNIVNGERACSCDSGYHPEPDNTDNCIIDEVCEADSCTEANKTVCSIVGGMIECSCDNGYHPAPDNQNLCVIDEVCDDTSCMEPHKSVCSIAGGMIECSCDNNYHDVNGTCVKNDMIDWCNTQWPKEVDENGVQVYGRVYVSNRTSVAGADARISAQLCYFKDGETNSNSTCVNAVYSKDVNTTNKDEYKAVLNFDESGIYHYYYQFKIGNTEYKKCDLNDNTVPVNGTNYENNETYNNYTGTANVTVETYGDLFISEYIEGKGDDKFIELYAIDGNVDLSGWSIKLAKNASSEFTTSINLNNINLMNGTTFVLSNTGAAGYVADQKANNLDFNGNDAVGLFNPEGELIDLIGVPGDDGYFAKDKRLIRKPEVNYPSSIFDADEWIPTSVGGVGAEQDNLGVHTVTE